MECGLNRIVTRVRQFWRIAAVSTSLCRRRQMSIILLLLVSFLWGSSFLFLKIAAGTFDPLTIAMARAVVATASISVWAAFSGCRWPSSFRIWIRSATLSVVGQVLPFVALAIASSRLTAGHVALIIGTAPLMTFAIVGAIRPTEVWNRVSIAGMTVGFLGLFLSIRYTAGQDPDPGWPGNICALLAALGYAAGALLSKRISTHVGSVMTVTSSLTVTTVILLLTWTIVELPRVGASRPGFSMEALVSLIFLGTLNTALAYVAYFHLVRRAGAIFAGLNNYLVPPLGTVAGMVWLGEPLKWQTILAIGMILGGAVLVAQQQSLSRLHAS